MLIRANYRRTNKSGNFVLARSTRSGIGISKKSREGAPAERFPDFDYLVDDHGCEADRHPDAGRFDRQVGPRTDLQTDHRLVVISPPVVGESKGHFPEQADQEQKEESETECAPIDEALSGFEKSGRGDERNTRKVDEIPREPGGRAGEKLPINDGACDQDEAEDYGSRMKTHNARHSLGRSFIIRHVISRHPVFVAPDVTQKHEHKTGQIEDELFHRYGAAACRDINAESGELVWEDEEGVAEKQVEEKADWRQHGDRTPKGRARKLQVGPGGKPPRQRYNRNDEEEQTPGVTKRRRIVGARLHDVGIRHGA